MRYDSLILEKKDFVMILRHRESGQRIEDYSHLDALQRLEENMAKATVHNLEDMPEDIIRLYSWVTVSSTSGWQKTFQVMLPYEQDINQDRTLNLVLFLVSWSQKQWTRKKYNHYQ